MERYTNEQVGEWYLKASEDDAAMAVRKRGIYGSADLTLMAAAMKILAESEPWSPTERQATDMALGFYQLGKVARKFGAWAQGHEPNEDSDVDLGVYSMMARRVREAGEW